MPTLSNLQKRIETIEKRNAQVEKDKAWEVSVFRKVVLMIFTYLSIGLYMYAIDIAKPWLNAIIPTIGYYLSTLTLPFIKSVWLRIRNN